MYAKARFLLHTKFKKMKTLRIMLVNDMVVLTFVWSTHNANCVYGTISIP
jgi:hypothetical protein